MVGWVVGAVVVALVAILLLAITALARKTNGVAKNLVTDLDSIAQKTRPLQDVAGANHAVQTITKLPARRTRRSAGAGPLQHIAGVAGMSPALAISSTGSILAVIGLVVGLVVLFVVIWLLNDVLRPLRSIIG